MDSNGYNFIVISAEYMNGESKVENNPGYEYAIVISSFKNKNKAIAYLEKLNDLKNEVIIEELDSNCIQLSNISNPLSASIFDIP